MGRELDDNAISSSPEIEYCVDAPHLLPIPSDDRGPTIVQFESFEAPTYSSDNKIVGGISDLRA